MTDDLRPESTEPSSKDASESEAKPLAEPQTEIVSAQSLDLEAGDGPEPEATGSSQEEDEPELEPKPQAKGKLERLQKILAQAGVASRRRAEELITQGRVQVNGTVVTELGTKADAGRDHIRVDGKLLQGAERLRYFVLNKPRGFVTTVKDPEGRPTVMQFFEKMRERLYPVGRLDYQSEGLLLVTNDGELANKLTKAASGVEKTYLVKVAGQPTEAELDILRAGVAIERGKPGSPQVRTAPARIRQVRQGDNPWYEVVLIEGRNRELRKMFEEIGHFVEKIRRVGYGPLVLDQEPGNLRELEPQELEALRKAAEGRLRTPKSKDVRRRNAVDAGALPTVAPRPSPRPRPSKSFEERPAAGPRDYLPKKSFETDRPSRPSRPPGREFRPAAGRGTAGPAKFGPGRPADRPDARAFSRPADRPQRPAFKRDDRSSRPAGRFGAGQAGGGRPASSRSFPAKPAWKRPGSSERPPYKRPPAPRPAAPAPHEDLGERRLPRLQIDAIHGDSPAPKRPFAGRPRNEGPRHDRPGFDRSRPDRSGTGRSSSTRPQRGESGLSRPFTSSSGKPRAGGARPSSKPDKPYKPAGRTYGARPQSGSESGAGAGSRSGSGPQAGSGPRPGRPYAPRPEGGSASRPPRPGGFSGPPAGRGGAKSGSGRKPKPSFGGKSKPGGRSRPPSKSGPRGAGGRSSGPRPGGKRSGPPGGKRH
jgi:23S rRNA pseudouridine2605 synthase